MASLDRYIDELYIFGRDINKNIDKIVDLKNSDFVRVAQHRLFNYGEDGDGNLLESYAEATIFSKVLKKHPFDRTTLLDTGSFYQGMFVNSNNGRVDLFSSDSKTTLLTGQYGKAILEFTKEEQTKLVNDIIDPAMQKIINQLPETIELEFI